MASVTIVKGMDTQPGSAPCRRKARAKEKVKVKWIPEIVGIVDKRVTSAEIAQVTPTPKVKEKVIMAKVSMAWMKVNGICSSSRGSRSSSHSINIRYHHG